MMKKLSIVLLALTMCASLALAVAMPKDAKAESSGITLEATDYANCSGGSAEKAEINGIAFDKVAAKDGRATYRIGVKKTDVSSVVGHGTAGNPSSYTGAVVFYAYLESEDTPTNIDFRIDHDAEDEYAQGAYRPRESWDVALNKNTLTKITAPVKAGIFGGEWGDSESLFSSVGGFCFDVYGINSGDLYISDVKIVPSDLTAVTCAEERVLPATISTDGDTNPSPVTETTLEDIKMYKADSTLLDGVPHIRVGLNYARLNVSDLTGHGTVGDASTYDGAIEFCMYIDGDKTPERIILKLVKEQNDTWAINGYRPNLDWVLNVESGKLLKVVAPISAGSFNSAVWGGDSETLFADLGGFFIDVYDVTGTLYVSDVKLTHGAGGIKTTELQAFAEPSVSVEAIADEAYTGQTVNIKPSIVVPSSMTLDSVRIAVSGAKEEEIIIGTDDDYLYTFEAAGVYNFKFTATINGSEYTAEKTITVKDSIERKLTIAKADITTGSSMEAKEMTLAGIPMYMVLNNVGNTTFAASVKEDGEYVDITSITGENNSGVIELYVYYSGTDPNSVELRLDRETEDSNSWLRYHQSLTISIKNGKLYKYTVPLSSGQFSEGFTGYTGEEAHTMLYNQLAGFMLQLVGGQGVLLVSAPTFRSGSAITTALYEEVPIEEPVIVADNVPSVILENEKIDLKPFVIEPTAGDGEATLSVCIEGPHPVNSFVPASDEDWQIALGAGEYVVTYTLKKGQKKFDVNLSLTVIAYEERAIVSGGSFERQTAQYAGRRTYDDTEYTYVDYSTASGTMFYEWHRIEDADNNSEPKFSIEDMTVEALALELYVYAEYMGSITDSEVRLGNCTNDLYHDAGWTYRYWKINDLPSGKLVKITLRLSDSGAKQSDVQNVYGNINNVMVYIATSDTASVGGYMLISDAKVVTTNAATGMQVVDDTFVPDLVAPSIDASYVGGDYDAEYNIVPAITKSGYEGNVDVSVEINYEGNVLETVSVSGTIGDELNGKLSEKLSAYRFPTGRTYTITVTATDVYGNTAVRSFTIEITGEYVDDVAPSISLGNIAAAAKRGDEIDLTKAVITDNVDAGADISVEYAVTVNGEAVSVADGKFVAAKIGTYHVRVTATDKTGNSASEEMDIAVSKKTEKEPTINVPDNFPTEYSVRGQVNLNGITAAAEDGSVLTVEFEVKAPDGSAVAVTNGKFTFGAAGEYTVKITATDADGNVVARTITVTAAQENTDDGDSGCGSCSGSAAMGYTGMALIAAAALLKKKRK